MKKHTFCAALPLALSLGAIAVPACADTVIGNGKAQITKDVASTQNAAMADARRDLVKEMMIAIIGLDRVKEVPPATIDQIAGQIRSDMFTGQTSERQGQTFIVHLTAEIDGAWFHQRLQAAGIDTSSQRADNDSAKMLVMLDETDGVASDFSKPAEIEIDYSHSQGDSFHDHSSEAASSHEADASSKRSASAYSASAAGRSSSSGSSAFQGSNAAAYRGVNGAAGSSTHVAGAASSQSNAAYASHASGAAVSASSHAHTASSAYAEHTAVDAEVHNDTSFHSRVVYQRPPAGSDADRIMAALSGALGHHGVATSDSWPALDAFYHGSPPRYSALKSHGFNDFLNSLSSRNIAFFLGGTFTVTHNGKDPATDWARCSGGLDATASAIVDGSNVASGTYSANAMGVTPEACTLKLVSILAKSASDDMGPTIESYWQRKARQAVGQNSHELADYTLVLHAASLGMAAQADILDALQQTPGVESENFVSQNATEIRFTVRYSGNLPLQNALYQKLRMHPEYAGMTATAQGRSIMMCISACGAAK